MIRSSAPLLFLDTAGIGSVFIEALAGGDMGVGLEEKTAGGENSGVEMVVG